MSQIITNMTVYMSGVWENTPPYIYAMINDSNTRLLRIKLMNDETQFIPDGTVELEIKQPGGNVITLSGTEQQDHTYVFTLDQGSLSVTGESTCRVVITDDEDEDEILSSMPFGLIVYSKTAGGSIIHGGGEVYVAQSSPPVNTDILWIDTSNT